MELIHYESRYENQNDYDYLDDDELMHYGVKGMHWGIRRYQNKDGSLTPLGKELAKQEKSEEEEKVKSQYDKKDCWNRSKDPKVERKA